MNIKKILGLVLFVSAFSFAYADNINGPDVFLRTTSKSVESGEVVKVNVTFSEPIVKLAKEMVAVEGGNLESVRKLSSLSYLLFIRAADKERYVSVQVEADVVQNLAKVSNAYASNELNVKIIAPKPTPVPTDNLNNSISKLLEKVVAPTSAANIQTVPATIQSNTTVSYVNCFGNMIPSTQTCVNPNVQTNINTVPVYDPYTGTYYYPQTNTGNIVNPYIVPNPYGNYNYGYNPTTYYNGYSTGLTPVSTYGDYYNSPQQYGNSTFGNIINTISNTLFDMEDERLDQEYYKRNGRNLDY